jgi:hypothetical protein
VLPAADREPRGIVDEHEPVEPGEVGRKMRDPGAVAGDVIAAVRPFEPLRNKGGAIVARSAPVSGRFDTRRVA